MHDVEWAFALVQGGCDGPFMANGSLWVAAHLVMRGCVILAAALGASDKTPSEIPSRPGMRFLFAKVRAKEEASSVLVMSSAMLPGPGASMVVRLEVTKVR